MWIYYYCSHGPGHQSQDDGFRHFHDSWSEDDIKEFFNRKFYDYNWPIWSIWGIKTPSAEHVDEEIKIAEEEIINLESRLIMLKTAPRFVSEDKEGKDTTIQKNLKSLIIKDLLRRLHRAGFMYETRDISDWRYGKKYPVEPRRSKILSIMRRTNRYPPISSQLRKK